MTILLKTKSWHLLTLKETHTKCLMNGIFLKLKDSWIPYTHCHSLHWWWGFVCLLPIEGFFTPHIDVVITSSPPRFHFFFNLVHVVLDELRTWHKKKVPTSNSIECTLLTPRIYLKSEVIRTIVSLGKTIFLKFTNFPFYSCLYKHHSHSMPHNFVCNQDMFHNSTMLFPTLPDFSKATTHTPTKQHKLTKHHTSHNSLSFIAAFITFNSPSFAKLISFCLQPFSSLKPKSRCDWHAKWNPFLHLFKPHVLLLQVYCLWAFWFPLSFPALLKNYRRTHFPQIR